MDYKTKYGDVATPKYLVEDILLYPGQSFSFIQQLM